MDDDSVVERELLIRARPETVFAFFTDPVELLKWIGVEAELTPVPGGIFRVSPNGRDVIRGEFVEVIPFTKVVFTWGYENPVDRPGPGSTTVEITLALHRDGTWLRLRHSGLGRLQGEKHMGGWGHYLDRLESAAAGGDPGPDPLADPDFAHG